MVPTHCQPGTRREGDEVALAKAATRCHPITDPAFARAVDRAIEEFKASATAESRLLEARTLEARLRRDYPRARVVARQIVVAGQAPGEARGEMRWYAFRDGASPRAPLEFE